MKPFFTYEDFKSEVYVSSGDIAAKANRLLEERGKVVYTYEDSEYLMAHKGRRKEDTHQALLINIQPIEKPDTTDTFLRDWIKYAEAMCPSQKEFIERAKRLLEGEK